MTEFTFVKVYPTTDKTLPAFDNTKLVALNTCPTWGIIRYSLHKTPGGMGRAMALEAGGAAHEVFAAHRLYHFLLGGREPYRIGDHEVTPDERRELFHIEGKRLFGAERFDEMVATVNHDEDVRQQTIKFSLTALYNSGFYDNPDDKRRTVTNIEESCIAYMDRYDWSNQMPALLNDEGVLYLGIEIPVDVTIEYTFDNGDIRRYRFIGKADALHYKSMSSGELRVHENKTASRLGDAWDMSWETNHQPTGYMIALSAMFNENIRDALMLGVSLPMPKGYGINGLSRVPVTRRTHQLAEWFRWFLHTVELHDQYVGRPELAPMYTHSCNRYFRPCSLVPYCAGDVDERLEYIEEMVTDEWSPLAKDEGSDE